MFSGCVILGFLLVLRQHGDLSHRGPLFVLVTWMALALLSCVWLKIRYERDDWLDYAISFGLYFVYGIAVIGKGSSAFVQRHTYSDDVSIFHYSFDCRIPWIPYLIIVAYIYHFIPVSVNRRGIQRSEQLTFDSMTIFKSKHSGQLRMDQHGCRNYFSIGLIR